MTRVTEEYQDDENSYCEFFGLVPFPQLAIQMMNVGGYVVGGHDILF
jgi:hypothetical protein